MNVPLGTVQHCTNVVSREINLFIKMLKVIWMYSFQVLGICPQNSMCLCLEVHQTPKQFSQVKLWGNPLCFWPLQFSLLLKRTFGLPELKEACPRNSTWMLLLQAQWSNINSFIRIFSNFIVFFIPEVSWVRPLLEGMVGLPSPFGSLRTILWYWSHFSVGLYEVKYNPTEKQLLLI